MEILSQLDKYKAFTIKQGVKKRSQCQPTKIKGYKPSQTDILYRHYYNKRFISQKVLSSLEYLRNDNGKSEF